jgi:TolB-like protein/DNA-binding winged helix-turn-helix (wHTH) protein/Flp pilus assembly protein TadD
MSETSNHHGTYIFGSACLDPRSRTLVVDGKEVRLPRRPFDVLVALIENRERVVSRAELLDRFWEGHDVYDDALRKCVGSIRRAVGDEGRPSRVIETRYGGGYRFVANVRAVEANGNGHTNGFVANFPQTDNGAGVAAAEASPRKGWWSSPIAIATIILVLATTLGFYIFVPRGSTPAGPAASAAPGPIRSIAVMPIKNLTGDINYDYFSEGITESIITELSRADELRIVSRTSTFALKDDKDPREIGERLNAEALLEGSLRKKDDLLVVGVRLVSTEDGHVIWTSRDFERPAGSVYELQETIACSVAIELRTELCDTAPARTTAIAVAYEAYLKGRYNWNKRTADGINRSIEYYEQAIRLDPNYALAYAGLAESYVQGIWHVPYSPEVVLPKAKKAALKALGLDETLSEGHTALANVHELNWDWAEAENSIRRAIELSPQNARAFHVQAFCLLILGRHEEAVASIERSRQLDPLNLVTNTDKAIILFAANRDDEALDQWGKTLELDPNFKLAYEHRAIAHEVLGNEPAAIDDYAKVMELSGTSAAGVEAYRRQVTRSGLREFRRAELLDLLAKESRGQKISELQAAALHAGLGNKAAALDRLEKIVYRRGVELLIVRTSRQFDPLKTEPRLADLFRRAGLPQ